MIRSLTGNGWLLALCGVLDAVMSIIYFTHAGHGFRSAHSVALMGKLALAAGVCTIAAGLWKSAEGRYEPLVPHGLALAALGLVLSGIFGPRISFLTVALLVVLMAISIGVLALNDLRTPRRTAELWLSGLAAVASAGFALAFAALGFRWVRIDPGAFPDLVLLGAFFGFSAICKLGLVLRRGRRPPLQHRPTHPVLPAAALCLSRLLSPFTTSSAASTAVAAASWKNSAD